MATPIRLDGTNLLVALGILLIVGAGAWQFIGAFLMWALWQVVAYYLVLAVVAAAVYGMLFAAVGPEGRGSASESDRDRIDETAAE